MTDTRTHRTLDASTPVLLSGLDDAWRLVSGEADLFVVAVHADGTLGRRSYVASLSPGALLLGADPVDHDGRSWQWLVVGVDAEVESCRPEDSDDGLYDWLGAAGSALAPTGVRVPLTTTGAVSLGAGQLPNAPDWLLWCRPITARLAIGGFEDGFEDGFEGGIEDRGDGGVDGGVDGGLDDGVDTGTAAAVPLGRAFCLEVTGPGTAELRRTPELDPQTRRAGLAWTQQALLAAYARRAAAGAEQAAARETERLRHDREARRSVFATFDRIDASEPWRPHASSDALLAACQVLGQAAGIAISKPPDWSAGLSADPVRAIARASGVRVRAVTLSGDWWRNNPEPMLAFREPDGAPVVCVPRDSGSYALVDPETGASRKATAATVTDLRPTAYVLYRPMPPGALSVGGLLRFGLRGSAADLARLLVFSLVTGLLSLALPVATGAILGNLVPVGLPGPVLVASLVLLLIVFATTGFLLSRSAALLRLQGRMLTRMQSGLWDRLIALPVSFFNRYSAADLSLRANGVDAIQQIVASVASQTLLAVITLVFSLGLLFVYSPSLALVVVGVTVVIVGASAFLTVAQIRRLRAMYDAKGQASGVLLQIVQGVDKIRASAAENRALGAWATRFATQAGFLLSSERLSAVRTAVYAMLPSFLTVIVFASVSANPGAMSTAAFLAFITALGQIAAATAQLDLTLGYALNVLPLFDRMRPILAEPIEVAPGAGDPGPLAGRLELAEVTYRYPGMDTPVLHEVNVTAEPGEFVALVGPSGSGKSTIVRLLLGFDRPESGSVTYDGKDLRTLDARAVRAQIGVALQNAAVSGSNILSVINGDWPLSEDDAWAAAEKVGLADDIRALPMGMRTMIGDNAVTFSGGQRQRLVLAAAIARNPRVVVLDEATSALDSVTQATVSESFDTLQVTRIVVAHRLSTIRHADKIVVLDRGRVVQQGSYAELTARPGIFANMVRRQTL